VPTINVLIRWQSAKPVKTAIVRARLGQEADTSPQARKFLEQQETHYLIAVLMPGMRPPGEGGRGARPGGQGGKAEGGGDAVERMKQATTLSWKNHEKVHPETVQLPREGQGAILFGFAKTHPIELDDKEVEFATRRGQLEIKKKFKLKDMVYQGQLSL
jgi:hypothetical protein